MSGPAEVKAKPATPRHAASLVLIRQGSDGPEVLMGRRPRKSAFAPDVFVFPGGKLDEADRRVHPAVPLSEACIRLTAAARRLAHALAAAALRETEEETGLILPLASGAGADFSHLTLIARAITPTSSPRVSCGTGHSNSPMAKRPLRRRAANVSFSRMTRPGR